KATPRLFPESTIQSAIFRTSAGALAPSKSASLWGRAATASVATAGVATAGVTGEAAPAATVDDASLSEAAAGKVREKARPAATSPRQIRRTEGIGRLE